MAANLFQPSVNRVTDSNGNPVSGARLSFFLTGTTTPATWYTDAEGTVPGTNPLVADASGLFPTPAYMAPETTYRVVMTDATAANNLWPPLDPVRGFDESQLATSAADAVGAAQRAEISEQNSELSASTASSAAAEAKNYGNANLRDSYTAADAESWTAGAWVQILSTDTGTHASKAGDVGASGGQTPNAGLFREDATLGLIRKGGNEGQLAEAWAEAATPPDPTDPTSKSAKGWAATVANQATALQQTLVIGRPTDPTADTNNVSNARFIHIAATPATTLAHLDSFKFWCGVSGTITLFKYNSANVNTASTGPISVTAGGLVTLTEAQYGSAFATLQPGDRIAFAGSVAGVIMFNPTAGVDGQGFGQISGSTVTPVANARFQVQINITYQSVTASAFAALSGNVATQGTAVAQNSAAAAKLRGPQIIGRPVAPAGTGNASSNTFVFGDPVEEDGVLDSIVLNPTASGNLTIGRYTKSGTAVSFVASQVVAVTSTGSAQTVAVGLTVAKGEYLSIYSATAGVIRVTSSTPADGAGWAQLSGNTPASGTISAWNGTPRIEVGFNLSVQKVTAASVGGPLYGLKVGFLGDSISTETLYGPAWRNVFAARTGAVIQRVDARPGRTFSSALEGYGALAPLASTASLTGYSGATTNPSGLRAMGSALSTFNTRYNAADGTTLAQWLADLDLLIVWLGTNDANAVGAGTWTVGSLSDAYTAGTMHAAMNFVFNSIMEAKPDLRVVVVTHYQTQLWYSYSTGRTAADAIVAQADQRGFPVLDAYKTFGVNSKNYATWLTDDGGGSRIHPLPAMSQKIIGPAMSEFARRWK